ncbi:MAG: IS91 family transposase [Deltaproteobacteria bacterium]|nr:IS91 family transposase [Deltaproteobacteria bacterium]MBW2152757.1 IS91 family transposase [Deltaproteobacteria bacterium]
MQLAAVLDQYHDAFQAKYGSRLLPGHLRAIEAISQCRTPQAGQLLVQCIDCGHTTWRSRSCGHRSCPQCQNHETSLWLDRQQPKLLPVDYFMATFTLPYELRSLAWDNQTLIYNLLFACASSTLKDFGLNPKNLGASIGMTAVLHTHNRRLDYHPHIHVVVPGGGVDKAKKQWKKKKNKYLFNEFALAKVFRARFLEALTNTGLSLPNSVPKKWVVDCTRAGKGPSALKYLSRYLYRGVIGANNIVSNHDGNITFKYVESRTGITRYRTIKGEDFLWLVLQHVLPKGFRRVRDYGFLHGNAKKLLSLVQLVLQVLIKTWTQRSTPAFKCLKCQAPMQILAVGQPAWASG